MTPEDLKQRYGRNRKIRARINFAIREEIDGGQETMDLLELTSDLWDRYTQADHPGAIHAKRAFEAMRDLRNLHGDEICRRYGIEVKPK